MVYSNSQRAHPCASFPYNLRNRSVVVDNAVQASVDTTDVGLQAVGTGRRLFVPVLFSTILLVCTLFVKFIIYYFTMTDGGDRRMYKYGITRALSAPGPNLEMMTSIANDPLFDENDLMSISSKLLLPFHALTVYPDSITQPYKLEAGRFKIDRTATLRSKELAYGRPPTTLSQMVTIYGRQPRVTLGASAHHPAGWNAELVLANGQPDLQAISKALGKIALNEDTKKRLNMVESAWLAHHMYDNPTALLVNFLRLYFKVLFLDASEVTSYSVECDHSALLDLFDKYADSNRTHWTNITAARVELSRLLSVGMSDLIFTLYYGDVAGFYRVVSDNTVGQKTMLSYPAFSIVGYNDGHIDISDSRFRECGFVNGRYMYVPLKWGHLWRGVALRSDKMFVPLEGVDVEAFGNKRESISAHYVHAAGLTDNEILTVLMAYHPSPSSTPFLVDMDVPMTVTERGLIFNRPEKSYFSGDLVKELERHCPKAHQIMAVLLKLVFINRWEESLFEAIRYITPFIGQPDPDTVEGHTWLNYSPDLALPHLGLFRGVHALIVSGESLKLVYDPLHIRHSAMATINSLLVLGPATRAMLQWGEYLRSLGVKRDMASLADAQHQYNEVDVNEQYYLSGLLSGMTGINEMSYLWSGTGVHVTRAHRLELLTTQTVICNSIEDETLARILLTGVRAIKDGANDMLTYTGLQPPSGIPFVVGLVGTLVENTPLHQTFNIIRPVARRYGNMFSYKMDWLQLWRWCTAHRWFGYDVRYQMPGHMGIQKPQVGWAANYVSVCPPPPITKVIDEDVRYVVDDYALARKHMWDAPAHRLEANTPREFTWDVQMLKSASGVEYQSAPSRLALGCCVATVTYTPSYSDLFLGMARVHLTRAEGDDQVFRIVTDHYTKVPWGQTPMRHADPSVISKMESGEAPPSGDVAVVQQPPA